MPPPTDIHAYRDDFAILDRALSRPSGIRIACSTPGEAANLRTRLYTARKHDRRYNREVFDPGDPSYGVSEYDRLIISCRYEEGEWWLYIQSQSSILKRVEDLPA